MHTPGSVPGDSPQKVKIIESRVKSFRSQANMELLGIKETKSIGSSIKIGPKYKMMYHQERVLKEIEENTIKMYGDND